MANAFLPRRSLLALALGALAARPAFSAKIATPTEKPLLTISGLIGVRNAGDVTKLDRPILEALGSHRFMTRTPWYSEPAEFEGVPMRVLLRAVEASGTRVIVTALNDYTTEIPISDFEEYDVLLALKRDRVYLPVRDKGPLFIVYPFDTDKRLQTQTYYGRSAWQVSKLLVS